MQNLHRIQNSEKSDFNELKVKTKEIKFQEVVLQHRSV